MKFITDSGIKVEVVDVGNFKQIQIITIDEVDPICITLDDEQVLQLVKALLK